MRNLILAISGCLLSTLISGCFGPNVFGWGQFDNVQEFREKTGKLLQMIWDVDNAASIDPAHVSKIITKHPKLLKMSTGDKIKLMPIKNYVGISDDQMSKRIFAYCWTNGIGICCYTDGHCEWIKDKKRFDSVITKREGSIQAIRLQQ